MKKTLLVLLVTGVMGTLLAGAADQPVPGGGVPSGGGPGGGWGAGGQRGGGLGSQGNFQGLGRGGMAGLDDQQRQLFQEALQKDSDKLRGLEEKLRAAQKELLQATLDTTYDEKAVRSKAEAMASIQVEIIMVRARALASVAPTMKAEQKQQLTDSPAGIAMLNAGGAGAGWGGGGPGGQGNFQGPGGGGMAGLDNQQRQVFQEALQKDGDKLRGLEEKLRTAQKELLQATLGSTYDEKAVRSKAEAMANIQVEITMVRAAALAATAPAMKSEQKQQLTESPFGMAILNSGGGGPRGGFPNNGPGGFAPGGPGGTPGNGFPGGGRDQAPRER